MQALQPCHIQYTLNEHVWFSWCIVPRGSGIAASGKWVPFLSHCILWNLPLKIWPGCCDKIFQKVLHQSFLWLDKTLHCLTAFSNLPDTHSDVCQLGTWAAVNVSWSICQPHQKHYLPLIKLLGARTASGQSYACTMQCKIPTKRTVETVHHVISRCGLVKEFLIDKGTSCHIHYSNLTNFWE